MTIFKTSAQEDFSYDVKCSLRNCIKTQDLTFAIAEEVGDFSRQFKTKIQQTNSYYIPERKFNFTDVKKNTVLVLQNQKSELSIDFCKEFGSNFLGYTYLKSNKCLYIYYKLTFEDCETYLCFEYYKTRFAKIVIQYNFGPSD